VTCLWTWVASNPLRKCQHFYVHIHKFFVLGEEQEPHHLLLAYTRITKTSCIWTLVNKLLTLILHILVVDLADQELRNKWFAFVTFPPLRLVYSKYVHDELVQYRSPYFLISANFFFSRCFLTNKRCSRSEWVLGGREDLVKQIIDEIQLDHIEVWIRSPCNLSDQVLVITKFKLVWLDIDFWGFWYLSVMI
jgi:hypothetical protein